MLNHIVHDKNTILHTFFATKSFFCDLIGCLYLQKFY